MRPGFEETPEQPIRVELGIPVTALVAHAPGRAGAALLTIVVVDLLVTWSRRRRRDVRAGSAATDAHDDVVVGG